MKKKDTHYQKIGKSLHEQLLRSAAGYDPAMLTQIPSAEAQADQATATPASSAVYEAALRQQAKSRLHRNHISPSRFWVDELGNIDDHMLDALKYGASVQQLTRPKSLADYPDVEMVMDMLRRGYAVMKLPKDGGPPEVFRG